MKREQQILEAAEKLFAERSFDGVGVDAIGKEAGVTGSAIYRHFASKDEILATLFGDVIDALLLETGAPAADPREDLEQLVRAHAQFSVAKPRLAAIWQREQRALNSKNQRSVFRRQHRYVERWTACLDKCYPGHTHEELLATMRAIHALTTSDTTRPTRNKRVPDLQELLVRLALNSLEALKQPAADTVK